MTIIKKIIDCCSLPCIVKKKHGNTKELTAEEFIEAILQCNTAKEAAKYLGIGEQTMNRLVSKYLIPICGKLHGGGQTWRFVLLQKIEYKYCYSCDQIKPYNKFGLDTNNSDGKYKKCRYCRSFDNASLYDRRKLRIPAWFKNEAKQIASFYENCPEGYHVDHIIPLQGSTVSGLHTLNNLQYLPAEENIKKSNSFDILGNW